MTASRTMTVPLTVRGENTFRASHVARVSVGAGLFASAVALPLLRQTGTRSWHTIWAEDGTIYYGQARQFGVFAVMFRGYAGYLQLPPRILGAVATLVPARQLPLYFAISAALVNALLAWFVYWASEGWITSRVARLALASTLVLLPALGYENTATITNTIWTFAAAAPWAIVAQQDDNRDVIIRSTVVFFAASATALTAIFIPVALGYAILRRTRAAGIVATSFLVGIAIQAVTALTTSDTRAAPNLQHKPAQLPEDISVRVFAQYALGDRGIRSIWDHRALLAVSAPIVILAIFALLLRGVERAHQLLAGTFLVLAIVTFVVPVWGRGTQIVALSPSDKGFFAVGTYLPTGRFSVVPVIMLASSFALVLDGPRRRNPETWRRVCVALFVAQIALVSLIGFSVSNLRSRGEPWSARVDAAYRYKCADADPSKQITVQSVGGVYNYPITFRCHELAP